MNSLLIPDWIVANSIKAYSSTRVGGQSTKPYDSLNLGYHVNDLAENVQKNRAILARQAQLPSKPVWLEQVHGVNTLVLDGHQVTNNRADAAYSRTAGQVCAVMTADCLPVLFCSIKGDEVAAAHAGWRGLCHGVLENTVDCFQAQPKDIVVWLGPAIGANKFEVGPEIRSFFVKQDQQATAAFRPYGNHYLADIYLLARQRLEQMGITTIYGGEYCTVTEKARFFSYRREGITGRMASLIWIA